MLGNSITNQLIVRDLGHNCDYMTVWQQATNFNEKRDAGAADELWLLEYAPVFTRGANLSGLNLVGGTIVRGNDVISDAGNIPVLQTNRAGGNAYHGSGQLIAILLMDVKRCKFSHKKIMSALYNILLQLLIFYKVDAKLRNKERRIGPFVEGNKKIGFVDFSVCGNCVYYGISLNVDMDLLPFAKINHCGIIGFEITHLKNYLDKIDLSEIKQILANLFAKHMKYFRNSSG